MAKISIVNASILLTRANSMERSMKKNIVNLIMRRNVRQHDATKFKLLSNISLELKDGDKIGILGANGSGKTSLLKALSGIYPPTSGSVYTDGNIVSILNFTSGFDRERTGQENLIIRGQLMGLSKNEIDKLLPKIFSFAELEEYKDEPIKHYSAGMIFRLSYTLALELNPDILLMDEVISTGDARFIEKSRQRIIEYIDRTKIFILASHDFATIEKFCSKCIVMSQGKIAFFGDVTEAINAYEKDYC